MKKINHIFIKAIGFYLIIFLFSCQTKNKQILGAENIKIDKTLDVDLDSTIVNFIRLYKKPLSAAMDKVIAAVAVELSVKRPEGNLNNLLADIYFEAGKQFCIENKTNYDIDGAILNVDGIRTDIPEGNITVGKIFEVMPFENKLIIVKLPGKSLRRLLDHCARTGGEGLSKMQMSITKSGKLGTALINGKSIDDDKIYHIVSIDYLINGGDGMVQFKENKGLIDIDLMCRDAILKSMKETTLKGQMVTSKLEKRVYYENQ